MKPVEFNTSFRRSFWFILIMACVMLFFGCSSEQGAGEGTSLDTGTITFNIVWTGQTDQPQGGKSSIRALTGNVCEDYLIDTVRGIVMNASNDTQIKTATFDCEDHGGNIPGITAGLSVYVQLEGLMGPSVTWRGQSPTVSVTTGTPNDAGTVVMVNIVDDDTAPNVLTTLPVFDQEYVPVGNTVSATFTEGMVPTLFDASTVVVKETESETVVTGDISYNQDSFTVTFDPQNDLSLYTGYTVTILKTVKDLALNEMSADTIWNFTTVGSSLWYLDVDNDGWPGSDTPVQSSTKPSQFYSNEYEMNGLTVDCDDNDPDEYWGQIWYIDGDGDGYGNQFAGPVPSCERPAAQPEGGYVGNNEDCDDTDPDLYPGKTWYLDADLDGFGNPESAYTPDECGQPGGYIEDSTDCDDGNAEIYPGQTYYADSDGDGYGNSGSPNTPAECGQPEGHVLNQTDCDDTSSSVYPGAPEECANGIDEDCQGGDLVCPIIWYRDADEDLFGNPDDSIESGTQPDGYVAETDDCNDNDAAIYPGATEVCDGKDNNCNEQVDEGYTTYTFYQDNDGDTYGNPDAAMQLCSPLEGYVGDANDCDDTDAAINPEATEVCDTKDNNCDGLKDEGVSDTYYLDGDGDSYGNPDAAIQACEPPSSSYIDDSSDCDDGDIFVNPEQSEVCDNGKDDDCNGSPDCADTVCVCTSWFIDADNDGYGDPATEVLAVSNPGGYISDGTDCDDTDVAIYPLATEDCSDNIDNDCDGDLDCNDSTCECSFWYIDSDGDGFGDPATETAAISNPNPEVYISNGTDCNDSDIAVNPGAVEICGNDTDEDCDGSAQACVLIWDQGTWDQAPWGN